MATSVCYILGFLKTNKMAQKRKFTKWGEKPKAYQCTKQKCKWEGTLEQQELKKNKDGWGSHYCCPNCRNIEFRGLLDVPIQAVP